MIQLPQRSVFRFFIPMIDVLTLLLGIYLLMPIVTPAEDPETEASRRERDLIEAELRKGVPAEKITDKLLAEIQRLRQEKSEVLKNRLVVTVLEIDPADGTLFYRGPDRVDIDNEADARRLIANARERLGVTENKELYFLILYPRDRTSLYPTIEQRQRYDRWFREVPLGYDRPGAKEGKDR